ncbi:oxygenase MpaB family protein [Leptospira sp. GIMC2001]|uniref:oxygenase MpaB family protein n=1 Tax=Leptospira sp. GIMC2001 TaxID=1513297 RepID=UPI00234BA772|nr:oxygenase MpaB family protein [Leptospira sp. GIMC2001]WCL47776.1 oxygenase MpaB family protein [Leptospira sp. GIMC2001]
MNRSIHSFMHTGSSKQFSENSNENLLVDRIRIEFWKSDPLADEVTNDFANMAPGKGSAMLNQALENGIHSISMPPESLVNFFAQLDTIPIWLDREEINYGAATFMRAGGLGAAALLCHSLPTGYLDPEGSRPLLFSGRLVQRAPRRLMETARYVYECIKPGGMERFGNGFKICVRVRLMHAQVRRLLLKSNRWDSQAWGIPINQWHLLGTNVLFSMTVVDALRNWGMLINRKEEESIYAFWRYNGYLIGIDTDILCATRAEYRRMIDVIEKIRLPATSDSLLLTEALLQAGAIMVKNIVGLPFLNVTKSILAGLSRNLLGRKRADELGLSRNFWRFLPWLMRPFVFCFEIIRILMPGGKRLAILVGERLWERALEIGLHGRDATFAIPQTLQNIDPRKNAVKEGSNA